MLVDVQAGEDAAGIDGVDEASGFQVPQEHGWGTRTIQGGHRRPIGAHLGSVMIIISFTWIWKL